MNRLFKFAGALLLMAGLIACEGVVPVVHPEEADASVSVGEAEAGGNRAAARQWRREPTPNAAPFVVLLTDAEGEVPAADPTIATGHPVLALSRDGASRTPALTIPEGEWFRVNGTKPSTEDWPDHGWTIYRVHNELGHEVASAFFKYKKDTETKSYPGPIWGYCGGLNALMVREYTDADDEVVTDLVSSAYGTNGFTKVKIHGCLFRADNVANDDGDLPRELRFQSEDRLFEPPPTPSGTFLVVHAEGASSSGFHLQGDTMLLIKGEVRDSQRSWPNDPYSEMISVKVEVSHSTDGDDWSTRASITYFQNGYSGAGVPTMNREYCAEQPTSSRYCGYRLLRRPEYTYDSAYLGTYTGRVTERVRFTLMHPHAPDVAPVVFTIFDNTPGT